ncbi:MAG: tryptophan synthase subunit alpha [Candidatus Dormibacteria bacterium]
MTAVGVEPRTRVRDALQRARAERRLALVAYLTAGFPSADATVELGAAVLDAGADVLELGIPFSDPMADGPTIQASSQAALNAGGGTGPALEVASRIRGPLTFMSYYNLILSRGPGQFCADAAAAGVGALIVPDLPPEESEPLHAECERLGLDLAFLVAPTSSDERIALIAARTTGFVYVVALRGTTGARAALDPGLPAFLGRVRRATSLPLLVGFGITSPEHVRSLSGLADGVVVGSALVDVVSASSPSDRAPRAAAFIAGLRGACR